MKSNGPDPGTLPRLATATLQRVVAGGWKSDAGRRALIVGMMARTLILKRASASRQGGEWNDYDLEVLADGVVVGRIMLAAAAPVGSPWLWTLGYGHHEDRSPTHGYEPRREAAMAAFAKSWRRE